jgi:hypothetical protein
LNKVGNVDTMSATPLSVTLVALSLPPMYSVRSDDGLMAGSADAAGPARTTAFWSAGAAVFLSTEPDDAATRAVSVPLPPAGLLSVSARRLEAGEPSEADCAGLLPGPACFSSVDRSRASLKNERLHTDTGQQMLEKLESKADTHTLDPKPGSRIRPTSSARARRTPGPQL